MFRIDRNYVHVAATRLVQIAAIDTEDRIEEYKRKEAMATTLSRADFISREIINEARIKAERMIRDAQNDVEALLVTVGERAKEDRRRAWQEGFAEGSIEGKHSFDGQLAEKMRLDDTILKGFMDKINDERERTYSGLEDEVKALALEVVKKVIDPAEEELEDVFESLIRNALKKLNLEKSVTIRVSPEEYDRFFPSGNAVFNLDSGTTVTASVVRDVALNELDCIIDYEGATVNAGLDSQLKYIKLAFNDAKNDVPPHYRRRDYYSGEDSHTLY